MKFQGIIEVLSISRYLFAGGRFGSGVQTLMSSSNLVFQDWGALWIIWPSLVFTQVQTLRPRMGKWLAQGHTVSKGPSWVMSPYALV